MFIMISDLSRAVAYIDSADYPNEKAAWKSARAYVRGLSHADGVKGLNDGWFTTANRAGYARGIFSAVPVVADRNGLNLNGGRFP